MAWVGAVVDDAGMRLAGAGRVARVGPVTCVVLGRVDRPAVADPAAALAGRWADGGAEALAGLSGECAAILWHAIRREALLVADPIGVRPLYWHVSGATLRVASELHHLLELLPSAPGPDHVSLAHWLAVSGPPGTRTLYDGVHRLGAGQRGVWRGGRLAVERWWRPASEPLALDRGQAATELRAALERSIARRFEPGATGLMLSGGLDSSAVLGVAAATGRRPTTYSAVFPDHPQVDESGLIDDVARSTGVRSVRLAVQGGSVMAGALDHLAGWAVPPVSPNEFFWQPLLARARADGAAVLLDGEGGDELYTCAPWLLADRLRRGRPIAAARLARNAGRGEPLPWRLVTAFVRQLGVVPAIPHGLHRAARRVHGPQAPPWFMPGSARLLRAGDHDLDYKRAPGPRWRAGLRHHAIDGPAPALARDHVRRRAAAAGLEASHPLLDPDVVELMLRLPPELSWDRENTRPVLRAAVDGLVPDHVRLRHGKSHFDQLFHGSLSGPDLPFLRSLLGTRTPEVAAYLDPGRLRTELLERVPGPGGHLESWAIQVWRIATAECWLRSLGDPAWPATALARGGLDEPRIRFGGPPLFSLAQPGAIGIIAQ